MPKREVGLIGLGKMGKNIAFQMLAKGYPVVAWNRSPEVIDEVAKKGARKAKSPEALVKSLKAPRTVWVMLPAGSVTIEMIKEISNYCSKGDTIIDGSNSFYRESIMLNAELEKKGINFIDAGCSGGPSGALSGMCIMAGGERKTFDANAQLFKDLSVPNGYFYTGPAGSGHFVKMVHNAIEYGMMQAISEGLDLIENGPYKGIDMGGVCELWQNGSVVRGYLIELATRALKKSPHLDDIAPYVEDNGEGRFSVHTAVDFAVPFTTISNSLYERFESRSQKKFGKRVLAALRHEFGGHEVKKE